MRRLTTIASLLLTLGAAAPPPKPAIVPSTVLDAMCERLRDEGVGSSVDLVRTSRPLVTRQSLQALAEMAFKERINAAMVDAAMATNETPLPIGRNAACDWHPVGATERRSPDTMTLELSAPFDVPFRRGGTGVLARLSLAGESATWYWVPLTYQNGAWQAGRAIAMALHQ